MDIGRMSAFFTGWLTLGMGVILATFQASGNERISTKEFMMCVSGPAMCSATNLRYLAGIWSGPVEVLDLIPLISLNT